MRRASLEERSGERKSKSPLVKDESIIGSDAADNTSGEPESPEEWAAEQPLEDQPTYALEPGDPSMYQPAAATPNFEKSI